MPSLPMSFPGLCRCRAPRSVSHTRVRGSYTPETVRLKAGDKGASAVNEPATQRDLICRLPWACGVTGSDETDAPAKLKERFPQKGARNTRSAASRDVDRVLERLCKSMVASVVTSSQSLREPRCPGQPTRGRAEPGRAGGDNGEDEAKDSHPGSKTFVERDPSLLLPGPCCFRPAKKRSSMVGVTRVCGRQLRWH